MICRRASKCEPLLRFNPLNLPKIPPPGGVLLGILGGGVPRGSPNPDPISDQKNVTFFGVQSPPKINLSPQHPTNMQLTLS